MTVNETIIQNNSVIAKMTEEKEMVWINPEKIPYAEYEKNLGVTDEKIADADARLCRFAPFIKKCFPETEATDGIIESPLTLIPAMQKQLAEQYHCNIPGTLLLKQDSQLAIAGSIKARGGIYEVLKHAEELAISHGMLKETDDYSILCRDSFRTFFSQFKVQVASTGNLGLSIGISSAALGFTVIVHMSKDAKQWKKDLLRSKGVTVIEYQDDYSKAVQEGRKRSEEDPKSYFVDDEKSLDLFLGYAVAAHRLQEQFVGKGIVIDENHPLIVYLPCGVGGAPGGVAYGLKRIFKEHVHCFFVEPTQAPSVLLGIVSGLDEAINVNDIGLSGKTHADGLAVSRPSGLVTRLMRPMLSGEFTVHDANLYHYLRDLVRSENIFIEPSSCAAFAGVVGLMQYKDSVQYVEETIGKSIENAVQIAWATGGALVPEKERKNFLNTYLN